MDQVKKAEWIAALRSGKYTQGHGLLSHGTPDRRVDCCLGVLCILNSITPTTDSDGHVKYNGANCYLHQLASLLS